MLGSAGCKKSRENRVSWSRTKLIITYILDSSIVGKFNCNPCHTLTRMQTTQVTTSTIGLDPLLHRRIPAMAASSIAASACLARLTLVSLWRLDRCAAIALTTSAHSLPFKYSAAYCHDIRNQRRILSSDETGRSTELRMSSGRSSSDWLRAMGNVARNPGREYEQCRRRYFLVAPQ